MMKFLNKKDTWVSPLDIGGGAGEEGGDWSYDNQDPFAIGEKN